LQLARSVVFFWEQPFGPGGSPGCVLLLHLLFLFTINSQELRAPFALHKT